MQNLGKKPNSHNLDLNNCVLSAADVTELASLLLFLPELEEISLWWNGCVGGTLKALTVSLHHVNLLKILRFTNCRLAAEDVTSLGTGFHFHLLPDSLDLLGNPNSPSSLNACPVKPYEMGLLSVSLPNGGLMDKTKQLALISASNSNFSKRLRIEGMSWPHLHLLVQRRMELHRWGGSHASFSIADSALQHFAELRKLDISCNKGIGGGFEDSTAHLASLKNLQVLDLHQGCVTEEDMTILSQVIPLLSSLQELNLSSNKNVGVSPHPLLGRLRFLPKLKSLAISNIGLGEDKQKLLVLIFSAEAALHLPELEILDLSWNKCVGGNLKLLLGALKLATEIQVLRLSSCNLVAEDLALLSTYNR
ncbi:LRC31 protein, partial [Rhynochetos jubatus]|nr:LRC31 protein [Rhynochetos jubatus]